MTGFHRLSILAVAALLAAGCGATPPTSVPPTDSPSTGLATPAPSSAVTTSTPPGRACTALDETLPRPVAHFNLSSPLRGSFFGLRVTRVSANADAANVVEYRRGKPYLDDPTRLVGGSQISLVLDADDDLGDVPITLIAASALLRIDGREPIELDGTAGADPEIDAFLFTVPDLKGSALIDFTVEYSGECRTYRAEGTWAFDIARAAFAAACPADSEGFVAHWESLGEPPADAGGVGVSLSPTEMIGLWNPGAVGSQGNDPLASWIADDPAAVTPAGETVGLAPTSSELRIESMTASFYRRGAVVNWLGGGDDPVRVFLATADPYPDGHLDLLVPSDPGRYVIGLVVAWETPCLRGTAVGSLSVDVE